MGGEDFDNAITKYLVSEFKKDVRDSFKNGHKLPFVVFLIIAARYRHHQ